MTKTYHDVEAVTRLLEEKEKDLELAAKIGQELLERNRFLDDKVAQLEAGAAQSTELLTQLRHELQVKTDLLRVFSNDAASSDTGDDSSPLHGGHISVDLLQRKISELEKDNRQLHEEATELAKEAFEVEEKEEKLVHETVKHLTEANVQISYLSEEFSVKSDESRKQKEEITHLLAQVCNLQTKSKQFSKENDELRGTVQAYRDTQEELTAELADFKEKYREIAGLLHDTQEELKDAAKRRRVSTAAAGGAGAPSSAGTAAAAATAAYPGAGRHDVSGMFSSPTGLDESEERVDSLLSEIHTSLRSSHRRSTGKKRSAISNFSVGLSSATSDFSDTEDNTDSSFHRLSSAAAGCAGEKGSGGGGGLFRGTFDTYKFVTANKMLQSNTASSPVPLGAAFNPGQGSSLDNSLADRELVLGSHMAGASPSLLGGVVSATSNVMSNSNCDRGRGHPHVGAFPLGPVRNDGEVNVKTIGELRVPNVENMDALSSPLGSVPGLNLDPAPDLIGHALTQPTVAGTESALADPIGSVPDPRSFGAGEARGSLLLGSVPLGSHPGFGAFGSVPGLSSGSLGSVPCTGAGASAVPGFSDAPSGRLTLQQFSAIEELGDRKNVNNVADGSSEAGGDVQFDVGTDDIDGEFIGGDLKSSSALSSGETSEIERALQKLTPEEVDRRRKMLGRTYSYDLGSDGFDSPGSLLGKPGFHFLPYGIRTPDSIMSTGSREWLAGSSVGPGGSSLYGHGWKLPDKLRLVKPMEGSLTLHHWQRLAVPHLGNILEERAGVKVKGEQAPRLPRGHAGAATQDGEDDDDNLILSDCEANEGFLMAKADATRTHATYTNSTVLHVDDVTIPVSSYEGAHMSSGFDDGLSRSVSRMGSRPRSRLSSFSGSLSDLSSVSGYCRRPGALTFSSNIGLARVLNERHIGAPGLGDSTLSLNSMHSGGGVPGVAGAFGAADAGSRKSYSLTPSVIATPVGDRAFSPTGTPLNSPAHTPPGTPPNERQSSAAAAAAAVDGVADDVNGSAGIVAGFFSSLRAALYGEQQKEQIRTNSLKRQRGAAAAGKMKTRKKGKPMKFGILEKVEEVGVENLMGTASPAPTLGLSTESLAASAALGSSRDSSLSRSGSSDILLEDFASGGGGRGDLTFHGDHGSGRRSFVGQLSAPSFSIYGRPSLNPSDFGSVPMTAVSPEGDETKFRIPTGGASVVGGRGPGRVISGPGEKRPQLSAGFGVPGHPGTGALARQLDGSRSGVRSDLGSVPVTTTGALVVPTDERGFIGNIASVFFGGRKGGLW